jgi:predicted kinase
MLYLIRGLPGSGKSTFADILPASNHEADTFFYDEDCHYVFDATKLSEAHAACQQGVKEDMENGINAISVANTFSRQWELEPYRALAKDYGYDITEITMTGKLFGNHHGVPEETINKMRDRWEK